MWLGRLPQRKCCRWRESSTALFYLRSSSPRHPLHPVCLTTTTEYTRIYNQNQTRDIPSGMTRVNVCAHDPDHLALVSTSRIRNGVGNSYRAAAALPSAYQACALPIFPWAHPAAVREEQRTGDVRYKPLVVPRALYRLTSWQEVPPAQVNLFSPKLRPSIY